MVKRNRASRSTFTQPMIFNQGREREPKKTVNALPFFKIIFFVVSSGFLVFVVFFSSVFSIQDIIIEGNSLVETERVEAKITKNQNIILFNRDKVRQDILSSIPEIQDVQIYRGIPNALKIVILEHNQSIVWASNGKFFLVSSEGYAYRDITDKISDYSGLPRVIDETNMEVLQGEKVVNQSFVAFIQNISDKFFELTNIEPDYFSIKETTFDVNLKTKAGFVVKLDSLRSSKKQLEDLKRILVEKRDQITEYIDLRINGWAYLK